MGGLSIGFSLIQFGAAQNIISSSETLLFLGGYDTSSSYSIPRNGTISSLAVSLRIINSLNIPTTTITIYCRLYSSPITSVSYSYNSISPAYALTPSLTGSTSFDKIITGIFPLTINVNQGDNIILGFYPKVTAGDDIAITIQATISAGVTII